MTLPGRDESRAGQFALTLECGRDLGVLPKVGAE